MRQLMWPKACKDFKAHRIHMDGGCQASFWFRAVVVQVVPKVLGLAFCFTAKEPPAVAERRLMQKSAHFCCYHNLFSLSFFARSTYLK
jgi:hypothetical protein